MTIIDEGDDAKPEKKRPRQSGRFAEDFASGTRVRWMVPPSIRVGAYGTEVAPSAVGIVTMKIVGGTFVRFDLPGGKQSEPFEPIAGQPCEAFE